MLRGRAAPATRLARPRAVGPPTPELTGNLPPRLCSENVAPSRRASPGAPPVDAAFVMRPMSIRSSALTLPMLWLTACAGPSRKPPSEPRLPPEPPPVACTDTPSEHQVTVTCRYYTEQQVQQAWAQTLDRAARAAIALGFSHVQFLSVDLRREMVSVATSVHCQANWGQSYDCVGGEAVAMPTSWLAVNQFALVSREEGEARGNDPLIPVERRPFDARRFLADRGGLRAAVSAGPPR